MAQHSVTLTVDGAEAQMLIAELCYFVGLIGRAEVECIIGHTLDCGYIASLLDVRRLRGRRVGCPFDMRASPTAELERALAALWATA